ncbi:MAG: PqqD family protein [Bacteriovoracaceae bacterium]
MLKDISNDTIFTVTQNYVHRKNPDGSVILMKVTDDDDFFKITGVASQIWQRIDGKKTINEILLSILSEYDVTEEQLVKDAEPFLKRLIELEIIA